MSQSKTKKEPKDFKEAFGQLEKLVLEFEKGDIALEEALDKFEQGLALASFCKKHLQHIENRVIDIKKKFKELDLGDDS